MRIRFIRFSLILIGVRGVAVQGDQYSRFDEDVIKGQVPGKGASSKLKATCRGPQPVSAIAYPAVKLNRKITILIPSSIVCRRCSDGQGFMMGVMPTTALHKIVILMAATLGAQTSLVAGESEFPGDYNPAALEEHVASHQPYPHGLLTKTYRDLLWSELSESPPELAAMGTPGVDGVRAYRLYLYFWKCARTPETEHADEWLSGWAKRTEGADTRELNSIDQRTLTTTEMIGFCMPIPPNTDRLLEAFAWLGEAARLDHEVAQITYYDTAGNLLQLPGYRDTTLLQRHPELEVDFRETTRKSLASALERGHPEAYLAMSGAASGEDPVTAYAFAHAARLLANEELLAAEHHLFANRIRVQKSILTQSLTSQEITEAEALARDLAGQ